MPVVLMNFFNLMNFGQWNFGMHQILKASFHRDPLADTLIKKSPSFGLFSHALLETEILRPLFSTFTYGSQILLRHFVCAFLNFLICQNLRRLAITTDPILLHITHRPPSMNICKSSVQELSLCCFPFNLFSWCSGYHIRLTRGRSPVRSRAKT